MRGFKTLRCYAFARPSLSGSFAHWCPSSGGRGLRDLSRRSHWEGLCWPKHQAYSTALNPAHAFFRFYAELNDHLPPRQQYRTVERDFLVPASVKDMIEGFGVPHTEVDLVLVNGESSDFSRLVRNGDRVALYPVFESLDMAPEVRLRPEALRELSFVLDAGRLAAYLRMLGSTPYTTTGPATGNWCASPPNRSASSLHATAACSNTLP